MPTDQSPYGNEILAMVLHELRTPLHVMQNALALCPADAGPPQAISARQIFGRQLGKAIRLLEDLTDMSRLTREATITDAERIDLAELVHCEAVELEERHRSRGMALALDLPSAGVWVWGSRLRLSQVVANLLDNSVKYSPPGGWITAQVWREPRQGALSIRDCGAGIRREDLGRIFDPFFRGATADIQAREGVGLGLALVKRLVELHGGSITVRSEGEGRGSEFTVRLPVIEP
jgi:two-component system CheB/CheR fusion protein